MERLLHHQDCHCGECLNWFLVMGEFTNRGRCTRCNFPIDQHLLLETGELYACPKRPR